MVMFSRREATGCCGRCSAGFEVSAPCVVILQVDDSLFDQKPEEAPPPVPIGSSPKADGSSTSASPSAVSVPPPGRGGGLGRGCSICSRQHQKRHSFLR